MHFDFSPRDQERFEQIVGFAREQFGADGRGNSGDGAAPNSTQMDGGRATQASDEFPRAGWRRLAELGMTGLPIPCEWGGASASALDTSRAIEALSFGGVDAGLVFSLCAHLFTCAVPIWKAGDERQRQEFLVPLAKGEWVGANGTTEENIGSDMSAMETVAERRNDRYILNGMKCFASNAPVADVFVLYATVNPRLGFAGLTAFIVDRKAKGLYLMPPQPKIGLQSSPFGRVLLENCEVPVEQRLGAEGAGSPIFAESMRWERACLFALYVGMMQRQLDRCIAFAKTRRQFGQSIGKFQSIANRLVDMKLRLEVSRLLLYRASWLLQEGRRCDLDIALSKLYVSESAVRSGLDAIQIHGGRGCLTEEGVEVDVRDAIPGRIFSGTSEIQQLIIARSMGL